MAGHSGDGRNVKPTDNIDPLLDGPANVGGISAQRLRQFIERIERLEEDRRAIAEDIKEVKAEAKGSGFDTKVIAFLIRERRKDKDDVDEFNTLVDTYKRALGMSL